MLISIMLNGKKVVDDISPDMTLFKFLRAHGCYSVKCGCETTNCGLCTVFLDEKPVLSCAVLAARAVGRFIADQGAEQCGFCNPGMIMNAIALFREKEEPTDEEIKQYLAGNLCRCSGYEGQLRGIHAFMEYWKNGGATCGK